MHTARTEGEPLPNTDPDLTYNIRKFNLKRTQAAALISNLKGTITSEITNLRNQAAQNIGQP
jgi:hypothetical protein